MGKVRRTLGALCGFLKRFKMDQSAVSAIEFALIAVAIALIVMVGVRKIGNNTSKTFSSIRSAV